MKYRLKKDTPEFKAGKMFTRGEDEYSNDCLFADGAPMPSFDVSLIDSFDEWFEEVKEPAYRRQRIKEVHRQGSCTIINYRVIRAFYEMSDDDGYAHKVREGIVSNVDISYDGDEVNYLNQMIELGFIEVENDNCIVWEDDKCD